MTLRYALLLILAAGAVGAALALWRMGFLFFRRLPVVATVTSSTYDDAQRFIDYDFRWLQRIGGEDWYFNTHRFPTLRVRYAVNGRDYRRDVRVTTRRGDSVDPAIVLWVDPADPQRATASGLGQAGVALLCALLVAGAAASVAWGW